MASLTHPERGLHKLSGDPRRAIGISGIGQKNGAKLKVSTNPHFSYLHECSSFMLNTFLCVCVGGVGSPTTTRGAEGGL